MCVTTDYLNHCIYLQFTHFSHYIYIIQQPWLIFRAVQSAIITVQFLEHQHHFKQKPKPQNPSIYQSLISISNAQAYSSVNLLFLYKSWHFIKIELCNMWVLYHHMDDHPNKKDISIFNYRYTAQDIGYMFWGKQIQFTLLVFT